MINRMGRKNPLPSSTAVIIRSTIPDNPDGWEQIESMARMLDALAHRAAAKAVAG